MATFQKRNQKKILQPLYGFYSFFKEKTRVEFWLVENPDLKIQGRIAVFIISLGI